MFVVQNMVWTCVSSCCHDYHMGYQTYRLFNQILTSMITAKLSVMRWFMFMGHIFKKIHG